MKDEEWESDCMGGTTRRDFLRLLSAGAATVAWPALSRAAGAAPRPLVFILAGQSNMVGAGKELEDELRKLPPNVEFHSRGKGDGTKREQFMKRFGPEATFAQAISHAFPDRRIVLVKHAKGGTSLLAWAPDWDPEVADRTKNRDAGPLYAPLMALVKKAVGDRDVEYGAVLWMQGERDAGFPAAAKEYGRHFAALIARFRKDLNAPDLPFIYGQVNPPPAYKGRDAVRAAQAATEEAISHTKMVQTDGLSKWQDNLHYDSEGQLELGRRFAKAYLELVGRSGE
ncbi:MAG: hypothetical protein JXR37_22380 [Kiritimatiellae bacterium]|nr:hypothetical protein [Kiritimatiellia bacterium]